MTEKSYFWNGNSVGDAVNAPYTIDAIHEIFNQIFCSKMTSEGVIKGYANGLQGTNPSGLNISINTGAAIVYGRFYENDAAIASTVTAPGAGFNYYTYVLRLTGGATQTIRVVRLGPSTTDYPTVTQSAPTFPDPPSTWEIELFRVRVSSASAVVMTDRRSYWRNNGYQIPIHLAHQSQAGIYFQGGSEEKVFDFLHAENGDLAIAGYIGADDIGALKYLSLDDADFIAADSLHAPFAIFATPITNNPNIIATTNQFWSKLGYLSWTDWTGATHATHTIGYLLFGHGVIPDSV